MKHVDVKLPTSYSSLHITTRKHVLVSTHIKVAEVYIDIRTFHTRACDPQRIYNVDESGLSTGLTK